MASCGTLTVVSPVDPSLVEVTSCVRLPEEVAPGQSVEFEAAVRNDNDVVVRAGIEWVALDLPNEPVIENVIDRRIPPGTSTFVVTGTIDAGTTAFPEGWSSTVEARVIQGSVEADAPTRTAAPRASGCGCSHDAPANPLRLALKPP